MIAGVDEAQRRRLHRTFETLCRIESPTGRERACAGWVTTELQSLGLTVQEDDAGSRVGSDAGNLLARIPGRSGRSILFCAHLDTVPLAAPVVPVRRDEHWTNEQAGILGADNKAAVAAIVELARELAGRDETPEVGVELLFTVAEETGLQGAREFDASLLRSDFGYVFDHASPLGEIITAAPTHMWITAEIRGRAAHAGLEPELGRSAIVAAATAVRQLPQGRLDEHTTANVGFIAGGGATNVVPERCQLGAEIRAVDQGRLDALVTQAIDALQDAADRAECDVDIGVQRTFTGYRLRAGEESVTLAQAALRAVGYEPREVATGAGSDANALRLAGFQCTNLANGTECAHQPGERVSFVALEGNLALMQALLREADRG